MTTQQTIDAINAIAYSISVMMELEVVNCGALMNAQKKLNQLINSLEVPRYIVDTKNITLN